MSRRLTFVDSTEKERLISIVKNESEAFQSISDFLKEHNYKSYYTRSWREGDHIVYDVGSWSEFFRLYD